MDPKPHSSPLWTGPALALAAAALFGASTPAAKILMGGGVDPWLMAGLLYLGAGIGTGVVLAARRAGGEPAPDAPLRRSDLPWLALVVVSGGVAGPLLLMIGLRATPASSASLLLNLEGLATMAIAWIVFRENVDRRLLAGAGAILAGAAVLSWRDGPLSLGPAAIAIIGACIAWGIDNNLTPKLSSADPLQITAIKGLAAGVVNTALAFANGAEAPSLALTLGALAVGFVGYGVSLVLFVLALRNLGAARTGAYFSTAPFIGAALAILFIGEPLTARLIVAGLLMAVGVYLHLTERHAHRHRHAAMAHEHRHVHDEHHRHAHGPSDPPHEPHSHWHAHDGSLVHEHPHYPDLHHRHGHEAAP